MIYVICKITIRVDGVNSLKLTKGELWRNPEFQKHRQAPHKLTPVPGVHKKIEATGNSHYGFCKAGCFRALFPALAQDKKIEMHNLKLLPKSTQCDNLSIDEANKLEYGKELNPQRIKRNLL